MHMVKVHGLRKCTYEMTEKTFLLNESIVLLDDKAGISTVVTMLVYYSHLTSFYVSRIIKLLMIHRDAITSSNKTLNY